ncbi:hypothetical protein L1987_48884 [Smallanthus sonchifolius]|uniref:Uncharacterized protein n=1 Tax=Smallanthus sonchifolius TaxID=185202 RepID=A0ACB9FT00_9ASTR|nr:hypothetical protein L1987_48884 [Smallanthus sonchifolius]
MIRSLISWKTRLTPDFIKKSWLRIQKVTFAGPVCPEDSVTAPPSESNGYLCVRCNGGLNQQRTAICHAVLAARFMNATLVLPELDANSYWHDDRPSLCVCGLYDVDHFIKTLQNDVRIVESIPEIKKNGKTKKIKAFQLRPPRDAPINWYTTTALEKMKEHGAIYLTPFSHRLAEEIDNPEYQRLRCRVNSLRHELQLLASNRPITIVTSSGLGGSKYGVIIIVAVVGYGYVWWKLTEKLDDVRDLELIGTIDKPQVLKK